MRPRLFYTTTLRILGRRKKSLILSLQYDHVDEITVDDIFALMIDAMEKETDVKIYDADITSDPYLGKNWSGGLFVDHHLPNIDHIFNE